VTAAEVHIVEHCPLPTGSNLPQLERLVRYVLAARGSEVPRWEIAVVLTSDAEIAELHQRYMGIDGPTDVMTFEHDVEPGQDGRAADIVVSVERAARQGPEHGQTAWDEVRFLVVHGLLHVVGCDDATPEGRSQMLREQSRLIDAFDGNAPLEGDSRSTVIYDRGAR
jgi:probable rRNA maturation factor